MTSLQITQYISALGGVSGCFLADISGTIEANDLPELFDSSLISEIFSNSVNVLETFRSEIDDCDEVFFDMSAANVYVKGIESHLLIVIVESNDALAAVRVAANVAARRFTPTASSAEAPAASIPKQSGAAKPLTSSKTSPIFGSGTDQTPDTPAEAKPKKNRGIWG